MSQCLNVLQNHYHVRLGHGRRWAGARRLLRPGCCKHCCGEPRGADVVSSSCFHFLRVNTQKRDCWAVW